MKTKTWDQLYHRIVTHSDPYYFLIKTPEKGADSKSCIEDLFDPKVFAYVINGKIFDPKQEYGSSSHYSKIVFGEKVVKPHAAKIDFTRFEPLLDRIVGVLQDYAKVKAPIAAVA